MIYVEGPWNALRVVGDDTGTNVQSWKGEAAEYFHRLNPVWLRFQRLGLELDVLRGLESPFVGTFRYPAQH